MDYLQNISLKSKYNYNLQLQHLEQFYVLETYEQLNIVTSPLLTSSCILSIKTK